MMKNWRNFLPVVLFAVMLLLLWEISVRYLAMPRWLLPAPKDVWLELRTLLEGEGWIDIWATFTHAIWGLGISVVAGFGFAVLLHFSAFLRRMIYPFLLLTQNIPIIALAPLFVTWFGFDDTAKIAVVILLCFFPIVVSVLTGLSQTDRTLKIYLTMAGASRMEMFRYLEFPSALPSFFSGLKVAATYSMMGAVIAEWLGAEHGLGLMMQTASSSFQTARMFAVIVIIVVLSYLLFGLVSFLERKVAKP